MLYRKLINKLPVFILAIFAGCTLLDSGSDRSPPEIPPDMQLYATVFGNGQGIWTFDPQTLEVQDTLTNGSSWSINFSPDYRTVYSARWDSDSDISYAYKIDLHSNEFLQQQEIWNPNLFLNSGGSKLLSMGGNPGIQVLDANTLEMLHEGHADIFNYTAQAVSSPVENYSYALIHKVGQNGLAGLMIFDMNSFTIKAIIPLTDDENRRRSMQGSYIDISPDGRYVYATVFNWQGGGGYGSFHVIDVGKGEQVFEAPCGAFAWLGVSPDGHYVYLSDSAGTPFNASGISYEFIPTNEILRYDVNRKRMEVFANGGSTFGLSGTEIDLLITSSIVVLPDSRSMFMRVLSAGMTKEGISPLIMHVDTRTREILNVYNLPPDPDGFTRAYIQQLIIGRRPG